VGIDKSYRVYAVPVVTKKCAFSCVVKLGGQTVAWTVFGSEFFIRADLSR